MQPVLVVFSLGLLATSVLFDLVALVSRQGLWSAVATWDLQAGLASGTAVGIVALASVAGTPRGSRLRELSLTRAAAHLGGLSFLAGSLFTRRMERAALPSTTAVVLSAIGLGLGALAAWLSVELGGRLDG